MSNLSYASTANIETSIEEVMKSYNLSYNSFETDFRR